MFRTTARAAALLAIGSVLALATSGCASSAPASATRSAAPSHSASGGTPATSADLLAPYAKGAGPVRLGTPVSLVPILRIAGCVTDPAGMTLPQARKAPRAAGNHDACLRVAQPVLRVDHVSGIRVGPAPDADGVVRHGVSVVVTLDPRDRMKLNRLVAQGLGVNALTEPSTHEVATVVSGVIVTTPQGIVGQLRTWPLTFASAKAAVRFLQALAVPTA